MHTLSALSFLFIAMRIYQLLTAKSKSPARAKTEETDHVLRPASGGRTKLRYMPLLRYLRTQKTIITPKRIPINIKFVEENTRHSTVVAGEE